MNSGYSLPRATKRKHEANSVEGHKAGDGRVPSPACTRGPLQSAFAQTARASRHCAPKVAHGHRSQRMFLASAQGVQDGHQPKSNVEFWQAKFDRNVARDRKEYAALEAAGWHVIVMWECEVKSGINFLADKIKAAYSSKE